MIQPHFATILDESPDEVIRPVPLARGTYEAVVAGPPRYDESSQKKTPFAEFTLRVIAALDDVLPDELEESGGLEDRTIKHTMYITDQAKWRIDEFHEACGIDLTVPATRRQRNEECVNARVRILVTHRPSQDGETVFAQIAKVMSSD